MVVKYWPQGEAKGAFGLLSEAPLAVPASAGGSHGPRRWPRPWRLRKRSEFDQVYSAGRRYSSSLFSAFVLHTISPASKVGFTVGRGLGKAARRNRIKRRMREAVRLHLPELGPGWSIVFHPRPGVLDAPFARLEQEVSRLFAWVLGRGGKP